LNGCVRYSVPLYSYINPLEHEEEGVDDKEEIRNSGKGRVKTDTTFIT
jgi:hypothetical protein